MSRFKAFFYGKYAHLVIGTILCSLTWFGYVAGIQLLTPIALTILALFVLHRQYEIQVWQNDSAEFQYHTSEFLDIVEGGLINHKLEIERLTYRIDRITPEDDEDIISYLH